MSEEKEEALLEAEFNSKWAHAMNFVMYKEIMNYGSYAYIVCTESARLNPNEADEYYHLLHQILHTYFKEHVEPHLDITYHELQQIILFMKTLNRKKEEEEEELINYSVEEFNEMLDDLVML
jgi:hypothetical protein